MAVDDFSQDRANDGCRIVFVFELDTITLWKQFFGRVRERSMADIVQQGR